MTRYEKGFLTKCAEHGIAARVANKMLKAAKARLVKKSDTPEPVSSATQYDPSLVNDALDKPSTGYTAEEADELRKYWSNYALSQALSGRPPAALPWPRESDSNPEFATTGQYLGQIIGDNGEAYGNDFWGRPRQNPAGTLAADLSDAPIGRKVETKYPFSGATSNAVNRDIFDNLLVPATPAQTNNVYKAIRAGLGK